MFLRNLFTSKLLDMLFSIIVHNSLYDFLISMAHKMKDMDIAFLRWNLGPGGDIRTSERLVKVYFTCQFD